MAPLLMPSTGHTTLIGDRCMPQVMDPVCGMTIDSGAAAASSEHKGMTHYYCSSACQQKFDANPSAYGGAMKR